MTKSGDVLSSNLMSVRYLVESIGVKAERMRGGRREGRATDAPEDF